MWGKLNQTIYSHLPRKVLHRNEQNNTTVLNFGEDTKINFTRLNKRLSLLILKEEQFRTGRAININKVSLV